MALSDKNQMFYWLSVKRQQLAREWQWQRHSAAMTNSYCDDDSRFPHRLARHHSILLRQLGEVDMQLQRNKITNLRLGIQRVNHILIKPGETFSFWRTIGKPSAERGFVEGLLIHSGRMQRGVGGGMCQLSNLIYWLALHTPLTVTEQHHHQFDAFPDSGRVLPFGSGATVFYNYIDLQLTNNTAVTFRLSVWLTDTELWGSFEADQPLREKYHVRERDHRFLRRNGQLYRENWLYREVFDRASGNQLREEHITHNFAPVMYELPPHLAATVVHEDATPLPQQELATAG